MIFVHITFDLITTSPTIETALML